MSTNTSTQTYPKVQDPREQTPSSPSQVCKAATFCSGTPQVTRLHGSLSAHEYTENLSRTNSIQTKRGWFLRLESLSKLRARLQPRLSQAHALAGKEPEFQSLTWTCPGYRNCCPVWTPSSSLDPQEQNVPKWVKKSRTVHLNPSSCMDWFYSTQEGHTARSSSIPERLCVTPGLSKPDWACYNHQWNLCRQCRICTSMYHD